MSSTESKLAEPMAMPAPSEPEAKKLSPAETAEQMEREEKLLGKTLNQSVRLTEHELAEVNTKKGLLQLLSTKNIDVTKALTMLRYERELQKLQIELVKLQRSVQLEG